MTAIQRLRSVWTGFPGGPGLTTMYFVDGAAAQSALTAFWTSIAGSLPPDVTVTVQAGGDVIEDTTGTLTAVWAGALQAPVVGSAIGQSYAAPVGLLVRWETLAIRAGSRLRGRTYVVPLSNGNFDVDGTLKASAQAGFNTAANAFVAAVTPGMLVWQRPRTATSSYVDGRGIPHKAIGGRLGSSAVVTNASVPDEAVVLRSRRD